MVCGEVWTGSERVLCTELWLRLGMLLLPPGLANQRFCGRQRKNRGWGINQNPLCQVLITPLGSSLHLPVCPHPACLSSASHHTERSTAPRTTNGSGAPGKGAEKGDSDRSGEEKHRKLMGKGWERLWMPTDLSALLEDGRAGGRAALGGAQQPAGTQQPQAGGGEVTGGDLELARVAPAQPCPCRSSCRQGVRLAKASAVERASHSGRVTEAASPLSTTLSAQHLRAH